MPIPICGKCEKEMRFDGNTNTWSCVACLTQPVSSSQYYTPMTMIPVVPPVDAVSKRSILDIMRFIVTALCAMSLILTLFGLLVINVWTEMSDMSFYEDRDVWLLRGGMNIAISLILILTLNLYLRSTVKRKGWWSRLQKSVDIQSGIFVGNVAIKSSLVNIFMGLYGTMITIGVMFLSAGIYLLNIYSEFYGLFVSAAEIGIGIMLIFFAYRAYQNEMETLSRDIYPMLFPKAEKQT